MSLRKKNFAKTLTMISKMIPEILTKQDPKIMIKIHQKINKLILTLKITLDGFQQTNTDLYKKIVEEMINQDLIKMMVINIDKFEFETRKEIARIIEELILCEEKNSVIAYFLEKEEIIESLFNKYENSGLSLICGIIIRGLSNSEKITERILKSKYFFILFKLSEQINFHLSTDAFSTLEKLLTKHVEIASNFLNENYEGFFTEFDKLLFSVNYVARRQSIRLLSDLLLERKNFQVMTKYINDSSHLQNFMNLIIDPSKGIQFDAFHVFKVLIANPKKDEQIVDILANNKKKLIDFLSQFQNENQNEHFQDEKKLIIQKITNTPEKKRK
ncbi:protein mo25 [Anaeramoeba ignava]|uniref:Protein mo25 n=1 Tax=Anaeramoeba ignava TaxID=1746090 RepID=A0A9Q0LEC4_ANAIG|nr:protein mo25 [Anaeramoeba ignava]